MTREDIRVDPWFSKTPPRFFHYTTDYISSIIPHIDRDKFRRVWSPFATDDDLHVIALRAAGFDVITPGGFDCNNENEFGALIDAAEPFDVVFLCAPDGMRAIQSIFMELVDRGIPFIMYTNLDGFPRTPRRYEYLRDNYEHLTLAVEWNGSPEHRERGSVSTRSSALYCRYYLAFKVFRQHFLFMDSQSNFFEEVDSW